MGKQIFEAQQVGPHRGHAAGNTDVEKAASQLVSDIKYKVSQELGKHTKLNPAQVAKKYMERWAASNAPGAVKVIAKKKLMGEAYLEGVEKSVGKLVENSIASAYHKVFVEGIEKEEENADLQLEETEENKVWIVVTDKETGNTYRRRADRAKIAELRANPNISRVEITNYHPDEDDDRGGQKTAKVKAGKGLRPGAGEKYEGKYGKGGRNTVGDLDHDGTREPNRHEYAGVKDNAIKSAIAKRKKKLGEEFLDEVSDLAGADKNKKKITGKGVNNSKIVKVFPPDHTGGSRYNTHEALNVTTGGQQSTQQSTPTQQQDPAAASALKQKIAAQKREVQARKNQLAAQQAELGKNIPLTQSHELQGKDIQEVAPPGMEKTVRGMKKHPELSRGKTKKGKKKNIYALAWYMYNQNKGVKEEADCGCDDKPKLKKSEGSKKDAREIPTEVNLVKNQLRSRGLKMSYEPEGDLVDEARAVGSARAGDQNPKGAAVRVSSGRGMTMTPARGLGASKPAGDDAARAARQAAQAKADRIAAARDRAASGEDRVGRLIRSVQKSHYEPEGEMTESRFYRGNRGPDRNSLGGSDRNSGRNRYMGSPTPEQEAEEKRRADAAAERAKARLRANLAREASGRNQGG